MSCAQLRVQSAISIPATTDPEPADRILLLAPPALGSAQAAPRQQGCRKTPSPCPPVSSILRGGRMWKNPPHCRWTVELFPTPQSTFTLYATLHYAHMAHLVHISSTLSYTDGRIGRQCRVQCFAQGRFNMWPGEAGGVKPLTFRLVGDYSSF